MSKIHFDRTTTVSPEQFVAGPARSEPDHERA